MEAEIPHYLNSSGTGLDFGVITGIGGANNNADNQTIEMINSTIGTSQEANEGGKSSRKLGQSFIRCIVSQKGRFRVQERNINIGANNVINEDVLYSSGD